MGIRPPKNFSPPCGLQFGPKLGGGMGTSRRSANRTMIDTNSVPRAFSYEREGPEGGEPSHFLRKPGVEA